MPGGKQPPRREHEGLGTGTKGRLADDAPIPEGERVGVTEPPYHTTGPAAISPLLERVTFPADTETLKARIGGAIVPVDRDRTAPVRDILDRLGPMHFKAPTDVHDALNRNWDRLAEREGRGGRQQRGDDLDQRPGND